mgnify:CR=1 FL=1
MPVASRVAKSASTAEICAPMLRVLQLDSACNSSAWASEERKGERRREEEEKKRREDGELVG